MTSDWHRLGRMAAQRRAELGLTQVEVAQRGPLSIDRVQAIEGAKREQYRLGTLLAMERALEWESGSVTAILAGGEPTPRPARDPDVRGADESGFEWMDRQYALWKQDRDRRALLKSLFESMENRDAG